VAPSLEAVSPVTDNSRAFAPRTVPAPDSCIRVGLLGYGQIGQAVARLSADSGVVCERALVRDLDRRRDAPQIDLTRDGASIINSGIDVLVEVLGGVEPARTLVTRALERGIPVVTANKTLMAAHGPALRALAAAHGVPLLFEAAVIAGVPFVGALARRPRLASVTRIAGILNGTSHFITTAIASGATFEAALADAQARGYAEPDSRADISGRDAAEKLTILLHLCGAEHARTEDITRVGIDTLTPADFAAAARVGGAIKPVAIASVGGDAFVGPAFLNRAHSHHSPVHVFTDFSGVTNALELSFANSAPLLFAGPGAGPDVTATTVLDDVNECVGGRAPRPSPAPFPRALASRLSPTASLSSAWFLRIVTTSIEDAHLAEFLSSRGLAAVRIDRGASDIAVVTVPAPRKVAEVAAETLALIGAPASLLPVLEGGAAR
jgi:homoserine dehydrogenase